MAPGSAQSPLQGRGSAPWEKALLPSSYLQRTRQWNQFLNPGLIPLTKKHEVLRAFHHNYQNSSQLPGISMFGNLMDSQRVLSHLKFNKYCGWTIPGTRANFPGQFFSVSS